MNKKQYVSPNILTRDVKISMVCASADTRKVPVVKEEVFKQGDGLWDHHDIDANNTEWDNIID